MPAVYVTSLAPGAGRTAVAAGLTALLAARGKKAAYFKPFSVVPREAHPGYVDLDTSFCQEALAQPESLAPTPVTADALADGLGALAPAARQRWSELSAGKDVVVVDGLVASGPTAAASAELAELADSVVAVVRYRRGMDLEEVKALEGAFGRRLLGVLLNAVPAVSLREAEEETAASLRAADVAVLGIIPEERLLLGFTVEEYGARLGGRVINNQEQAGEIVESLLIGAMALDPGEYYYERTQNKALITRGNRPDLQWSALESSTRCLILTQDMEPIPYVLEKAKEEEVPVMVVPKGTLDTVAEIEGFVTEPTFHHPQKLARFTQHLEGHADLSRMGL